MPGCAVTLIGCCSVSGPETRWVLRWQSPAAAAGDVLIHVAANAANYDDSPLGDFIYVGEWRVSGGGRPR